MGVADRIGDSGGGELAAVLSWHCREIDGAFAKLGACLADGLSGCESARESLSSTMAELARNGEEPAGNLFVAVASALRDLHAALPDADAKLGMFLHRMQEVARVFAGVSQAIRMMRVLAVNARIESCYAHRGRTEDPLFENNIALVSRASEAVRVCLKNEAKAGELVRCAVDQQGSVTETYAALLPPLAEAIERTSGALSRHRAENGLLVATANDQAGRITEAAGTGIIALQGGDRLRQRLEHCVQALSVLARSEERNGPADGRSMLIRRILARQLAEAAEEGRRDLRRIEASLEAIVAEVKSSAQLGHLLSAGDRGDGTALLTDLDAALRRASGIMSGCVSATALVDRSMESALEAAGNFRQAVADLSSIGADITLMAMNAGLRATRLGDVGRGLVVIADEMRIVSNGVRQESARLSEALSGMQETSSLLARHMETRASRLSETSSETKDAIVSLQQQEGRTKQALTELDRSASAFGAAVAETAAILRSCWDAIAAVEQAASTIAEARPPAAQMPGLPPEEQEAIVAFLGEHLFARYTMESERRVHRETLAECGLPTPEALCTGNGGSDPLFDLQDAALF